MSLLDDFVVRAALGGVGVALAAAPLGCFVVWRRMAYFGDATAHAAILGVALALAFEVSITFGVLGVAIAMALGIGTFAGQKHGTDTLLGVAAHSALALGLVATALLTNVRVDLISYLFGDILAISRGDLALIWLGAAGVVALLYWRWSALLTSTLNPDLAYAAGIKPQNERLALTLALAVVVAVAIKVVGALLISALLIIPAAAARPLATTPERMAFAAVVIAASSALGGLWVSFLADTPTGPTIVCTALAAFLTTSAFSALARLQ